MKVLELTPGFYKIRRKEYHYGGRRKKFNSNTPHILRVEGRGDSLKYFIDNDPFGRHPSSIDNFGEEYEIISRYPGEPQVQHGEINLCFDDASGDHFCFTVKDAWTLRNVFENNPWLKRPFNFLPNRSKIVKKK